MKISGDRLYSRAMTWIDSGCNIHAAFYLKMALKIMYDNELTEEEQKCLTEFATYVYVHETPELTFEVEENQ